MTKEIKAIPAFTKVIDQGVVEHLAAVFGNIDDGGDIIHPGSFRKTILERQGKIRCLDQHATDSIMRVIGKPLSMREIGRDELPPEVLARFPDATGGLLVKTQFLLNTPEGLGAFERIKAGAVDEYSIGYDALDADYSTAVKDGEELTVRNLRQLRLYEYSPVIFAMNPATATLSAKAAPSEGKPWAVFEQDGKWIVYKVDENGEPVGDPVGTHDSEDAAREQVRALYASEEDDKRKPAAPPQPTKAGRIFAARNVNRLRQLAEILEELLEEIGEEEPQQEEPDDYMSGKQAAAKAGPGTEQAPPTTANTADLLHLIEIELEEINLTT